LNDLYTEFFILESMMTNDYFLQITTKHLNNVQTYEFFNFKMFLSTC